MRATEAQLNQRHSAICSCFSNPKADFFVSRVIQKYSLVAQPRPIFIDDLGAHTLSSYSAQILVGARANSHLASRLEWFDRYPRFIPIVERQSAAVLRMLPQLVCNGEHVLQRLAGRIPRNSLVDVRHVDVAHLRGCKACCGEHECSHHQDIVATRSLRNERNCAKLRIECCFIVIDF